MFNSKNNEKLIEREIELFNKRKELIDRESELYRKEKFFEIDKAVEDYRSQKQTEIQKVARMCQEELAQYEHEFHFAKETKGIELAKLQSKIESFANVLKSNEEAVKSTYNLLESKDAEIKRLNDIISLLINKQPQYSAPILSPYINK